MYVSAYDHNCIAVFKTSGEFLTSFGSKGDKKKNLSGPIPSLLVTKAFVMSVIILMIEYKYFKC